MGAKARIWFDRAVLATIVGGAAWVLWALPVPFAIQLLITALGIAIGAAVAFRQIPAFDPRGRVRWRLTDRHRRKICALTFDDGPTAGTSEVLSILSARGVKATFFVLAENARRRPDLLRRAAADGHTIAFHGNTHRKLHRASEAEVAAELDAAESTLRSLGVQPARLYRTPHGVKCASVFRVAQRMGLTLWAWSRGVWDTDRPAPHVLVDRSTRLARSGMVLLLHDGRGDEPEPDVSAMVKALPDIVQRLQTAGFSFVTLDRPTA